MKAVIIGGGIAGLAAAISFKRNGIDAVVKERAPEFTEVGLGFILLPNGLRALDTLGAADYIKKNGAELNTATLRNCSGKILKTEPLIDALAVKRSVCIDGLAQQVSPDTIQYAFDFSHFEYDNEGNAVAAVSKAGERETGDIFIAADGANSKIRKQLFSSIELRDSVIRELVGIADSPSLVKELKGKLLKTQSGVVGLSIGVLPCNETQLIWYIQYDSRDQDLTSFVTEDKEKFVKDLVKDWPHPINEVLDATNFAGAFLWHTKDMEVPKQFHKNNVVLLGDAAHLALPFTSQGTNSALTDAMLLADLFTPNVKLTDLETVFMKFHEARKNVLNDYIQFGRMLEQQFLHPQNVSGSDLMIPLAI
jgi:2-polyprenyl-6-methoxyphenol hydroxylase-like FAD-dependent oxidoreductase